MTNMRNFCAVMGLGLALTTAALAASWPGRPTTAPPKLTQPGPPPAWIETHTTARWLAYSSYCWKTRCVDYLPPASRPDLPRVRVARGGVVRIHFAFVPKDVRVTLLSTPPRRAKLPAALIVEWKPP